jgi:hypothetical protein
MRSCAFYLKVTVNRAWWYTPVIPEFRRLRQEDLKSEASLDYIKRFQVSLGNVVRPWLCK